MYRGKSTSNAKAEKMLRKDGEIRLIFMGDIAMGYSIRKTLEKIRNKRQTRLDEEEIWRTTEEGNKIKLNGKGEIIGGNRYAVGKALEGGAKVAPGTKYKTPTKPKVDPGKYWEPKDISPDAWKVYHETGHKNKKQKKPTGIEMIDLNEGIKSTDPELLIIGSPEWEERERRRKQKEEWENKFREEFKPYRGRDKVPFDQKASEPSGTGDHVAAFIDRNDKEALKNVGNVTSGKNGDMKPKKDDARTIDTKDALKEIRDGKMNSLAEHMDENGNLSAERQAVHDEIIRNMFANKVPFDGQPTMIMSGGGPASGKSFITKNAKANFGEETVTKIDPDDIKKLLPGYTEMAKESDQAAAHYHEESSALAKRAYQFALDNGLNVVYDGTGDGSINSVKKKIDAAREAGCKVNGEYVTVDTEEAIRRNQKRYDDAKKDYDSGKSDIPPRKPPEGYVRECHQKVTDISVEVAGLFDSFTLSDNNVPEGVDPIKIAECTKGGTITAVPGQEDKLQKFLDKGVAGHKVENGKVV